MTNSAKQQQPVMYFTQSAFSTRTFSGYKLEVTQ